MIKKAALFDDTKDISNSIHVNKNFETKYNAWKGRELKEKLKNQKSDTEGSSSSSEEEDSDAEILTRDLDAKVLETVERIRNKDKLVYDENHVFFPENDEEEDIALTAKKNKPLTYTKFLSKALLEEGADAIAKEEERIESSFPILPESDPKLYSLEQKELKQGFLEAAKLLDENDDETFLSRVEKTEQQLKEENESFQAFLKRKQEGLVEDSHLLDRYLRSDDTLQEGEKFLRDYILLEGWKHSNSMPQGIHSLTNVDEEDESNFHESENFEAAYNFRFEENANVEIEGHARKILDSFRVKENTRRQKRLEKAERKKQEKELKKKELEKLKEIKRQELLERLQIIQKIAGIKEPIEKQEKLLNTIQNDFDPETHDLELQQILGDTYADQMEENVDDLFDTTAYEEADELLTKRQLRKKEKKLKKKEEKHKALSENQTESNLDNKIMKPKSSIADEIEPADEETKLPSDNENLEPDESEFANENNSNECPITETMWYLCDGCFYGIKEGAKRYDCLTCDNFTLCGKCFRSVKHPHNLIKKRVPVGNKPPKEAFEGLYAKNVFEELPGIVVDEKSQSLVDQTFEDYYNLDYEDMIGGMPVRFKYAKVDPDSFGFSTEDILQKPDKIINSLVPLKKLAPYRKRASDYSFRKRNGKQRDTGKKLKTHHNKQNHSVFKQPVTKPVKVSKHKITVSKVPEGINESRLEAYNLSK